MISKIKIEPPKCHSCIHIDSCKNAGTGYFCEKHVTQSEFDSRIDLMNKIYYHYYGVKCDKNDKKK